VKNYSVAFILDRRPINSLPYLIDLVKMHLLIMVWT